MKTLVYENYNKFITATDAVKKATIPAPFYIHLTHVLEIKESVANMKSDMERLEEKMSFITTESSRVQTFLSPNRDRIAKLSSVRSLLRDVCS